MNSKKKFTLYFVLILVLTFILSYTLGELRGVIDLSEFSSIGGIIEGTIGVGVAFAGAYVAIKIAQLGTDLAIKQKARDDYVKVNEILLASLQPLKDLTVALNAILETQQSWDNLINEFGEFVASKRNSGKSDTDINRLKEKFDPKYATEIIQNFGDLSKALDSIMRNPYTYYLWVDTTKAVSGAELQNIKIFSELGRVQHEGLHPAFDLIEIQAAITKRVKTTGYYGIIGQEIWNSYTVGNKAFKLPYHKMPEYLASNDHRRRYLSTRSFVEIGANFWYQRSSDGKLFYNIGGAILHDIIISIPSSPILIKSLEKMFSEIFDTNISDTPLIKLIQEMGDSYWMSNSIRNAKEMYKSNQINFKIQI